MNENEEISRNLQGDVSQKVKDKESAQKMIEKIEKIVDEAKNMDSVQFLSLCRTLIQANYDLAYIQLIGTLLVQEKMEGSEDAKDTIANIESLIKDMKEMDYIHFLAVSRVLISANYDVAYSQLNSMLKVDEIMKDENNGTE